MSIGVGLVGTGYAARVRADCFHGDGRSHLVAVAGRDPQRTQELAAPLGAIALPAWQDLVHHPAVDLVVIATINREHGAIARAALQAKKHVVVEYPLALDLAEAEALLPLAQQQQRLLHVEHIELLSGIQGAIAQALPHIGTPFYVRYSNLTPKQPAPDKWTYCNDLFGFPLVGALARLHRLIRLFGNVSRVSCQARFWGNSLPTAAYTACLTSAQLKFASGLVADVIYGKGQAFWNAERTLSIQAENGGIWVDGDMGSLTTPAGTQSLDMGSRRGLFAQDTTLVLDHLTEGTPLYVSPEQSLYALRVADATRRAAETGQVIELS